MNTVKVEEDHNHYCYMYFYTDTGAPCYVGEGSGNRAYAKHSGQNELNELYEDGEVDVRILHDNLTKGEAETLESYYIKKYRDEGFTLFNKQGGKSSTIIEIDIDKNRTEEEIVKELVDSVAYNRSIEERATPDAIINEIIDNIINSAGFTVDNKSWLNVYSRFGEFYKPVCDKVGFQNIRNNFTMVSDADKIGNHVMFWGGSNHGEAKMNEVLCINENFMEWNTSKKFDVIIMNPPFKDLGEKFICKCIDLLKDGGYLGVVMLPTWRSITTTIGNKSYYKLLQEGGFHLIHMYSANDTRELFRKSIGQVDTFVWQKGVSINNTKVVNQRGDEYFVDLSNYPQAPPVLHPRVYDKYFDQVNGLKWYIFTHPRDKAYGLANHTFIEPITGKEFQCNDANIENTRGKKVMIDSFLSNYHIDDIGDVVGNTNRMFFFNDDNERVSIINALDFIITNEYRDLFVSDVGRKKHAFIPGIRV